MKDLISIICSYTDQKKLNTLLLESLKKQKYKNYETILLNNRELGLNSASRVLNYGVQHSNGSILVFIHQDVQLLEDTILDKIVCFCNERNFGIAGAAGISIQQRGVYSSVVHGQNKSQAGKKLSDIMEVDACDECFFFMKREGFLGFGELGDTWHFYAIEYALKCKINGRKVYAVPLPVYHLSSGDSLNNSYWETLIRVGEKYRGKVKTIPTTLGMFRNNLFFSWSVLASKYYTVIIDRIKRGK